jgi:medium-chain acyl-[acyl-carrier-protein] hydrolase
MKPLVEALAQAIQPNPSQPLALFGHCMGAIVAFELARELRRRGGPSPFLLMPPPRATQFRRNHVPPPEPSDEELLRQAELPALRADTTLCRRYSYAEHSPLPCPVRAYRGKEDPNITREHLKAWNQ